MWKFWDNLKRPLLNRLTGQRGALLVEAMLAVIILSVSLVMIIQALAASARGASESEGYSRAVLAGENALFELGRSAQKGTLPDTGTLLSDPQYQVNFVPLLTDKSDDQNIVQEIKVDVSWEKGKNKKQISFSTYLAKPPG